MQKPDWLPLTPLTYALMAISIIVTMIYFSVPGDVLNYFRFQRPADHYFIHNFFISESVYEILPELQSGQLWRLITPIFIHLDQLHILFNMFWLYLLGTAIELHQGRVRLLVLVVVTGILSNLAEYIWSGPIFGGMSGVIYALLGYLWVQGQLNPRLGLRLNPNIFIFMMVWLIVCWTGAIGNIANMGHTSGLISGVLIGWLYSPPPRRLENLFR